MKNLKVASRARLLPHLKTITIQKEVALGTKARSLERALVPISDVPRAFPTLTNLPLPFAQLPLTQLLVALERALVPISDVPRAFPALTKLPLPFAQLPLAQLLVALERALVPDVPRALPTLTIIPLAQLPLAQLPLAQLTLAQLLVADMFIPTKRALVPIPDVARALSSVLATITTLAQLPLAPTKRTLVPSIPFALPLAPLLPPDKEEPSSR